MNPRPLQPKIGLALLTCALAACQPPLDAPDAALAVPASLPAFAQEPPAPSVVHRAKELVIEGESALQRGDLKTAVPLLTQALSVDPSSPLARVALARAFVRGGRSSVALKLLEPAAAQVATCGACVELLQAAKKHTDFKMMLGHPEAAALWARVPSTALPYATWATAIATSLQAARAEGLAPYVSATRPFELVRSCPRCTQPGARAPNRRTLLGMPLASKLAARFDPQAGEGQGVTLRVTGKPTCAEGCCTWPLPDVAVAEAALKQVCLTPSTPTAAVLTRVEVVYGDSRVRTP